MMKIIMDVAKVRSIPWDLILYRNKMAPDIIQSQLGFLYWIVYQKLVSVVCRQLDLWCSPVA